MQNKQFIITSVSAAIILASGLNPSISYSQESTTSLEEIVVTARKRSESVLDVPISIAVVSEDNIAKLGAQDFTDLLGSVPSLTAYQNGPGRTRLFIRGISNGGGNDNDTQNQETVSIYLDEVPISVGGMNAELGLFDSQRVEVLRGPQGTLFGAGSLSGTVRMVSNKPDFSETSGKVEVDAATVSKGSPNFAVRGVVNTPVSDNFALRLGGYYVDKGGFIDNISSGEEDINDSSSKGFKLGALWQLSDNLSAEFTHFGHKYSDNGYPADIDATPELTRDYPSFDGFDDEMSISNLVLKYSFENMELLSSTTVFDRETVNRRSLDRLFGVLPPALVPHELVDTTNFDAFVQEVRLSSTTDAPLQWTVGLYTDKKDVFYENTFPIPGSDDVFGPGAMAADFGAPKDHFYYGFDDLVVETKAVFGELYYGFGDWTLTAGLRYFDWEQDIKFYQSGQANGGSNSDLRPKSSEDGVNPKLNLSYKYNEDVTLYAQAARGFRYGGINGAIPESVCADELAQVKREGGDTRFFDSDQAWTYELGAKGRVADGSVRFNTALFHVKWKDMQTSRGFECGFGFRENVGQVTSNGLELEINANLNDNWSLGFGGAYIDATLDQNVPNLNAFAGDFAPFIPDLSFNMNTEYTFPVTDDMLGYVWFGVQHVGERNTEFDTEAANNKLMKSYEVANFRAGVEWGNYQLSLYAQNMFDDRGVVRATGRPPFDPDAVIRVEPRAIGITFRTNF